MEQGSLQSKELLQYFNMLNKEEKEVVFTLIKTMSNQACLRVTGQSIDDYNKDLELAESEPAYSNEEVMNKMSSWLKNKNYIKNFKLFVKNSRHPKKEVSVSRCSIEIGADNSTLMATNFIKFK